MVGIEDRDDHRDRQDDRTGDPARAQVLAKDERRENGAGQRF
jgi:hypothetical protein